MHELLPVDYPRRVELYSQWFQNNLNNKGIYNIVFFSDEA